MKRLGATVLGLSAVLCFQPPVARANDDLIRGVIGLGTAIILNEAGKNNRQRPRYQQPRRDQQRARAGESREVLQQRAEIQRRLNALGYDAGKPDGVFGPKTRRAIAAFQQSLGRNPDGKLSSEEVAELYRLNEGNGFAAYQPGGELTGEPEGFAAYQSTGSNPAQSTGFPSLGAADGQDAGSGAFPALASGATDGQQTAGMPTLGTQPRQDAGGFPTLGAASGQPAPAGSFPTLGAPAENATGQAMPAFGSPPAQSAPAFPQVTPAAPAADPSMPAVAAAPVTATPGMPPLSAAAAPGDGSKELTLDAELARTPFTSRDRQPVLAGVTLGNAIDVAAAKFTAEGFAGCTPDMLPMKCVRETGSLTDTIAAWAGKDHEVWALLRTISFKKPAPADLVKAQLKAGLPGLYSAPGYIVGTGSYCGIGQMPATSIEVLMSEIGSYVGSTVLQIPDHVAQFAEQCPLTYFIAFDDKAATVHSATFAFVDMSAIRRQIEARRIEAEAAENDARGEIAEDFKL